MESASGGLGFQKTWKIKGPGSKKVQAEKEVYIKIENILVFWQIAYLEKIVRE